MSIDRRTFLKGGMALAAFAATGQASARSDGIKDYNLKPKTPLSSLTDVSTGKKFTPLNDEYILAYFGTAHAIFPGCSDQLLQIGDVKSVLSERGDIKVRPVIIYPPATQGSALIDRYVKREVNGVRMTGLTSNFNNVIRAGDHHKMFYTFKQQGHVTDHNQGAALIRPDGTLLRKFTTRALDSYTMVNEIEEIDRAAKEPSFGRRFGLE